MTNKMKHLDLFTGYGGFSIPMKEYGIETIGYSEVDKYANAVLKYRFPDTRNFGDVTKIDPKELPDIDIITGGTPCQDLSVCGKNSGLHGERSRLFFDFVRIVNEKQPRYFIWENVKGALYSNRGWDFARVQIELAKNYEIEYQILNSKDFGVPQNRERVFIVGHLRGSCGRKVFPITRDSTEDIRRTGRDVSYCIDANGLSICLQALSGGLGAKTGLYAIPVNGVERVHKTQNGRRFKSHDDPMFTLTSMDRHGIYDGYRIRRLTPVECERLQGLEDNWTKFGIDEKGNKIELSDTQRYKMIGNGVTVNVVSEIVKSLCDE